MIPQPLGQHIGKQDYKQDLMAAIMAVRPTKGNFQRLDNTEDGVHAVYDASTATRADISEQLSKPSAQQVETLKAAQSPAAALAMTQAAISGCAELMKERGRKLTQEEVKAVVMGLAA
ncbi:hypothetical protein Q9323_15000 [Pseudomonas fulva]|uniref:hypothetical protein n=1 Tax=Pseudomonas fulva TaxID=47880 RepID=UPI0031F5FE31